MNSPLQDAEKLPKRTAAERRRRKWLFRALCVSFPFGGLLLLNLALYVLDIGHDTRLIVPLPTASGGNQYRFNEWADAAYGSVVLDGPHGRPFVLPKPADTYRVVVLGASSVQGFPFPSELAFSQHLQLLLNRQFDDRRCEVLNAGIVAISSHAVLDVLRQSLGCQPDLLVVYAGHNEFYGLGGSASGSSILSPSLIAVRRFRVAQKLAELQSTLLLRDEPLITTLSADRSIRQSSQAFTRAEKSYRRNLEAMVAAASRAGVPIVLCSVACNLRDQSPMHSIFRMGLGPPKQRELLEHLREADELLQQHEYAKALVLVDRAQTIDSTYALASYRRAQCLQGLKRLKEAAHAYSLARDLDGCRYRAPSRFRNIVREVASNRASGGAHYVDLVDAIARNAEFGTPGNEFFFEHVHFNLEGHWRAALEIARVVFEKVNNRHWDESRVPNTRVRDRLLVATPHDQLEALRLMLRIMEVPPLSDAPDCSRQLEWIEQRFDQVRSRLPKELQGVDWNESKQWWDFDVLIRVGLALFQSEQIEHIEESLKFFERAIQRQPWSARPYIGAAACHYRLGHKKTALERLDASKAKVLGLDQEMKQLRADLYRKLRGP